MEKSILSFVLIVFFFLSCQKENDQENILLTECGGEAFDFDSGALVVNEGSFQGSGTLSHINLSTNLASKNIYKNANCDVPAGLFVQSAAFNKGKGYIIAKGKSVTLPYNSVLIKFEILPRNKPIGATKEIKSDKYKNCILYFKEKR